MSSATVGEALREAHALLCPPSSVLCSLAGGRSSFPLPEHLREGDAEPRLLEGAFAAFARRHLF